MSDEANPKPLRRARVTLSGPAGPGYTIITNDDGSFKFERLPAGRYTVAVAKQAYVRMNYGAKRTDRPGTGIVVADRSTQRITVRLARGAVITGTVLDADGQPAPGIVVNAMKYISEGRLAASGMTASTDDRGVYRIFGLPAGDYFIAAPMRSLGSSAGAQVLSEADIRQALAELRELRGPTRSTTSNPASVAFAPSEPRRTLTFAAVFYPGTASVAQATTVAVGPGEERTGIDLRLEYVPTATLEGTLVGSAIGQSTLISLSRSGGEVFGALDFRTITARQDGRFSLSPITPGEYILTARSVASSGRATGSAPNANAPPAQALWATTQVSVSGQDITDLVLSLQPGLTISGRVVFDGTTPPPPMPAGFQLPFPAEPASVFSGMGVRVPPVQVEPDGRFTLSGVIPVPYRIRPIDGVRSPFGGWWLKSVTVNGRDVLDRPLDARQITTEVVVTISDRASELSGKVIHPRGDAVSDYFVIAFSTDSASWFFNSRLIAALRPEADGVYAIRNLPPGEYYVVATDDVETGEWFDASFLKRLAPGAARITLAEYEKKTHDIVIAVR